ncbi:MAG: hypothetical protein KF722_01985 [Nitrospira sp.]|nr:hypothetical protein [Nitrospira sp.]
MSLQPDLFTGTLTGGIPIEIPPGRNAMQPDLKLIYASRNGNGWLGMGWKLELGTIERQRRFGIDYSADDYTVTLSGVSMDLVSVGGGEYRAKIENSFQRLRKLTAADGRPYWEMTDKEGKRYLFGQTAASRIADPADANKIFKWSLDWVVDRDGNYMKMAYVIDQGQGYLSEIRYAGYTTNGLESGSTIAPTTIIKFYLETPVDVPAVTMYLTHFAVTTGKRLRTIEERSNGALVRVYKLGYSANTNTSHSLLTTLQQVGNNASVDSGTGAVTGGTALPAVSLGYQSGPTSFTDGAAWVTGWCIGGAAYLPVDLNGDGIQDLWCPSGSTQSLARSNGNGGFTATSATCSTYAPLPPADFTGDGRQDLWCVQLGYWGAQGAPMSWWHVAPSTAGGSYTFSRWTGNGPGGSLAGSLGGWWNGTTGISSSLDFNGDGKHDLWLLWNTHPTTPGGTSVVASTGTEFPIDGTGTLVVLPCSGGTRRAGEFNGDAKQDAWCHIPNTSTTVLLSTGSGVTAGPSLGNWCSNGTVDLGDFNGDGKSDLSCHATNGSTLVTLSTGSAFTTPSSWQASWCSSGKFGVADFNGDGKSDVYCHPTDGTTSIALSTGISFVDQGVWMSGWCATGNFGAGDFNGDAKQDLYCVNSGQVQIARSGNTVVLPDLLVSITNGVGSTTTITYTPSTQYTNTLLPASMQTVSSLTTTDGNGNISTITYTYSGGFRHVAERDFRGFKTAIVTSPGATDADKTVTTTWFHQGNEITPIDTEDPRLANGYMKGKPYRVEVRKKNDANFLYAKTETTYLADQIGTNTTAPWFTPPAQVDNFICEGVPPCTIPTMRVTFAPTDYDAYGNVLKESHHGDVNVTGDEKTIQREFVPPNTTDHVVSALKRETVYKGISVAVADRLAETLFYYDGTGTGACTATPTGSNTAVTKGKLTKIERWLNGGTNPISGMEYDPTTGVLLCSRDPLGNKTTLTYDPTKTFVLTSTNQLGHVTTTVYSGVNGVAIDPATGFYGTVKTVTDPNGRVTSHEYDALGRKTKTTAPDGLVTTVTYPTLAEYGVIGTQKISTTTSGASLPAALTSSIFFDGLGRTIKEEGSGPNSTTLVTETQYDVKGQMFRTSLPYFKTTESVTGRWRTMTYDALGRVTQVIHPDTLSGTQLTSKSCYAPFVTVTLDPSGARKRETKDAYGRVVKIEEYSTTTSICDTSIGTPYAATTYTYDLLDNLTKVVDTLGNRTTMRYDSLSRKIAMSDPDMSTNGTSTCGDLTTLSPAGSYPWYAVPCWNYQYDAAGNLTRQTDAKNQHLWFRYDGLNRRTQKDYTTQKAAGSGDVRYIYDDTVTTFNRKGRLKQTIDAATNVTFEYDALGRISKSTRVLDGTTYVTTSAYDGLGRLKEVTYPTSPTKTVEYLYTGPVLDKVQDKAGSGTTIYATYGNYTSQGQAQTITFGNGVVTTSTFADPAHPSCVPANSFKLCTLKTQKGTNPLYQDFSYTFTADGNVDLIADPINGNQDFGYDALDRLTTATGPYGTGGATDTITYGYNQIGNILANSQLTGGTFTYPSSGAGVVRPHAVQVAGPYQYSYDNNGNQTGITSTLGDYSSSTTFNVDNRLTSAVTTFGSTTINSTFVYDGEGSRVKKIVGTTTTRYINKFYECDTTGSTTSCSRFIWGDNTRVATVATNGTTHYWHGDHLDSSSVITTSTGAKAQALTYSPFGGPRTNQSFTTPAVDVPYKYTGKEFDYSTDFLLL